MNIKQPTIDLSQINNPYFMNDKVYRMMKDILNGQNKRYYNIKGGTGGGKSNNILKSLLTPMIMLPNQNIIISRKYYSSMRFTTMKEMKIATYQAGLSEILKMNHSTGEISIHPNYRKLFPPQIRDNQISFIGLSDVDKWYGLNASIIYIEEALDITKDDFTIADNRARLSDHSCILTSFNPKDINHWIKSYFEDNPTEYIKGETENITINPWENKHLSTEYLKRLEALKYEDEWAYNVFYLGLWGQLSGLILDQNKIHIEKVSQDFSDYTDIIIGLDWGFNHKNAILLVGIKSNGDIYVLRELVSTGMTNPELMFEFKNSGLPIDKWIVADSESPGQIKEWSNNGFMVEGANKGPGSVELGIDYLRRNDIYVDTSCTETIGEMRTWKWAETKDGIIKREPVKINDDCIAAIRYATERYHRVKDYKGIRQLR